ncbi:unnamed protein product, partial [Urochloa humidicola]
MTTPVRSVPPTGRGSAGGSWKWEKRHKTAGRPPQVQEKQGAGQESDEYVFSSKDHINPDELRRCYDELCWRESFLNGSHRRMGDEETKQLYHRLRLLRFRDYKILKGQDWDPTKPCPWDSISEPGPSIFGWTYDPDTFNLHDLDDYQRIVPTRVDFDEFYQYETYCRTLSCYRTDKEYVKYYDEISKKIK